MKLGFIGQGWVGKNYADHFQDRGFEVVRYALEESYVSNKNKISACSLVFIAVPTPTTPEGYDDKHVRDALALVSSGSIAVIKSTIPPGTVNSLVSDYADVYITHVPEFLRESHARYDVDNPDRIIVGIPEKSETYIKIAEQILELHPQAPYQKIVSATDAEFLKYTHNALGYATIVFMNILFDLSRSYDVNWGYVKEFILNNPWFPEKYLEPLHKGGRGAGGSCFIKDFAALVDVYKEKCAYDKNGIELLDALVSKNNKLLFESGKDTDIVKKVYKT